MKLNPTPIRPDCGTQALEETMVRTRQRNWEARPRDARGHNGSFCVQNQGCQILDPLGHLAQDVEYKICSSIFSRGFKAVHALLDLVKTFQGCTRSKGSVRRPGQIYCQVPRPKYRPRMFTRVKSAYVTFSIIVVQVHITPDSPQMQLPFQYIRLRLHVYNGQFYLSLPS